MRRLGRDVDREEDHSRYFHQVGHLSVAHGRSRRDVLCVQVFATKGTRSSGASRRALIPMVLFGVSHAGGGDRRADASDEVALRPQEGDCILGGGSLSPILRSRRRACYVLSPSSTDTRESLVSPRWGDASFSARTAQVLAEGASPIGTHSRDIALPQGLSGPATFDGILR